MPGLPRTARAEQLLEHYAVVSHGAPARAGTALTPAGMVKAASKRSSASIARTVITSRHAASETYAHRRERKLRHVARRPPTSVPPTTFLAGWFESPLSIYGGDVVGRKLVSSGIWSVAC